MNIADFIRSMPCDLSYPYRIISLTVKIAREQNEEKIPQMYVEKDHQRDIVRG
jgi:hypothetical protein